MEQILTHRMTTEFPDAYEDKLLLQSRISAYSEINGNNEYFRGYH
jgi:hypothetical protein